MDRISGQPVAGFVEGDAGGLVAVVADGKFGRCRRDVAGYRSC
jgi:hypothetical protein